MQFALMAAYLGSTAIRTLGLRRSVVAFEMVQAAAVLVAGLGGAAFVTARAGLGAGALALGALSLCFGAAAYGIAFAFVQRERSPANFYFYTTAGAAFVLAGRDVPAAGGRRARSSGRRSPSARRSARGKRGAGRSQATRPRTASRRRCRAASSRTPARRRSRHPDVAWSPATLACLGVAVAVGVASWALGTAHGPRPRSTACRAWRCSSSSPPPRRA